MNNDSWGPILVGTFSRRSRRKLTNDPMTAIEIYNHVTGGGGNDFAEVIKLLEASGSAWCLIGGLAVNAYVEPTLTLDADFVVVTEAIPRVLDELGHRGY